MCVWEPVLVAVGATWLAEAAVAKYLAGLVDKRTAALLTTLPPAVKADIRKELAEGTWDSVLFKAGKRLSQRGLGFMVMRTAGAALGSPNGKGKDEEDEDQ